MQEDGVNRFNQPQELHSEIRKAAIEAKPPRRSLPALINPTASICSSSLMSRYNNTIPPDMPALHLDVTWRCWWSAAAACTHTSKPFPWCTVWSINHQSINLYVWWPHTPPNSCRIWDFGASARVVPTSIKVAVLWTLSDPGSGLVSLRAVEVVVVWCRWWECQPRRCMPSSVLTDSSPSLARERRLENAGYSLRLYDGACRELIGNPQGDKSQLRPRKRIFAASCVLTRLYCISPLIAWGGFVFD